MPEPAGARERLVSSGLSILLHVGLALVFVFLAQLAKEEIVEQVIEVTRVNEPSQDEPAPAPARDRGELPGASTRRRWRSRRRS